MCPGSPREVVFAGRRILVVDDGPDVAESLATFLETRMPGAEVVATQSPTAALATIWEWKPHLVIADFQMPGMNGVELLEAARGGGHVAVLITAYHVDDHAVDAGRRGIIRRFYRKPFNLDQLADGVAELLLDGAAKTPAH